MKRVECGYSAFMKRTSILFLLCAALLLCWREWRVAPNGNVTVDLLDIGQGDAIFITSPSGRQILVDGGPDLSALAGIGRRMSLFDRQIDLLVLSHPHQDHLFALPAVIERYGVHAVLLTGVAYNGPRYEELLNLIRSHNVPVIIADPTRDIDLGDGVLLDVLWPLPVYEGMEDPSGGNDSSVAFRLTYGADTMLFTGDMEKAEEDAILASGADVRADILKVAHHGSKTSTSTGFLLAVDPELAVISVAKENDFSHPSPSVMERLKNFDIPVRTTAEEGVIRLEFDGR